MWSFGMEGYREAGGGAIMGTSGTRVWISASSWNFKTPRKRLKKANTKRSNSARRYEVRDAVLQLLKSSVMCVPVVKKAGIAIPWPWSGFISMVMFTVLWSIVTKNVGS